MKKQRDLKIRMSRTIVIVLTGCMLFIMASTITADPHYPPNEYTIPLQDQWNLITVPVNASIAKDQITIRNNSIDYNFTEAVNHGIIVGTFFGWDRENQTYFIANDLGFEPGKGYWLWAYYPCSLIIHSDVRGDGYITNLLSQWNMMGQTYNSTLALANLSVLYNGTSYSWANATTADNEEGHPLLIGVLFKWDGANQWYDLSTGFTSGEGYWMYAYHNCSLRQVIDAPVIIDNSADTTGTGDSYVCNASVSDPDGVISVWLEYWYAGGLHSFVQMNPTGVGSYYEMILTIPSASVDSLHYIIAANDTKNYWNTTLEQTVIVNDDDAPVITNVLASPSSTSQGGFVNISCEVTDNIAVNTVRLHLTYPDLSKINISMNKDSHYYLNQSYSMGGSYQFFVWANDTSSNINTSSVHTFTITSNTHTITASSGSGGSITPSGSVVVNHGGYKNFTITPNTGYHILDVLVDGGSVGAVTYHNFTNVIADHTIAASFAINTYTISASAGAGGSIAPSGTVVVNYGGFKNFTITPNSGYIILDVLVDSISSGAVPYYNFTNVITNHSISASFKDNTPPTLSLNFAGNPSDSGGPYYLPGTNTPAPEGYYTNASYQKEKWIQIKCTATDNVGIEKVWLHWRNGTQWTNNTYQLTHTTGNYYEINMSTNIAPGPKYSFDLLAVDTSGNTMLYRWLKIGADTTAVDDRRYVQLGGTPTNISYTPYYFYPAQYKYTTGYGPGHNMTNDDNLHHDQGPDGTLTDSGYLLGTLPTSVVQERYCTMYVGYWFDETITAQPSTIRNIYHHFWWQTNNHNLTVAYGKSDAGFYRTEAWGQSYPTNTTKARTNISYNSITYYLESALMKITSPQSYTDNDIYEFFVEYYTSSTTNPSIINNRSIQSFVIFNVPDNTTLQGMDTDSDGLTDYQELYVTFTNPFVQDTDNDGVSDYYETVSGSDPNDYKDTINPLPVLSSESPQNQSRVQPLNPPLSINISQYQNHLMNVTFRTNATGTWQTIGTNLSVPNGTYSQTPTTMNNYSTTYYWSVHCNAGSVWTNKTYHFTTWAEPRGWIYYKKITVNHSLVNQSLTNFPILIKITDTDLVNHAQPSARDVQFWDVTNTTRYHHEIEKYNDTTGEFIAWVNITYLSVTQDTIIWMRYGNTTCGSQENIVGTWDGNYVMVQHLNETGNTVYDSTSYGNNGLSTGTDFTTTGKIDGGRQYNDNDKIVANNFTHSPNALTAETWVYRDATAFIYISCKGTYSSTSDWILYLRNNQPANQGIDFSIKNHTSYIRKGDTPVNRWFYLTATYNSGSAALYFNGTQIGSGTGWPSIPNSYLNLGIGNDYMGTNGGENPMTQVKFDEFRVSKIARNSSWIRTSYNTMSQPASFIHVGSEEQITFSLTITHSGTGLGTVETNNTGPYYYGTKVMLWANASTGSTFSGWSGALSGLITPQNLVMNGNKVVDAAFTLNTFTITASAGTGGIINPSGAVIVNYNGYKNFTITPDSGYDILNVLVDGGSVGAVSWYNFTNVATDHTIAASFEPNIYTLTITKSGTGSGTVQTNISAPYYYGVKVKLWANASTGSTFSGWSGGLGGSITPETLTITADVGVDAAFTLNGPYTLTITTNGTGEGTVERNTTGPYYHGAKVKLWANASVGSTFTGWSGALSGTVSPQTLTMDDNKAVNVQFTHLNQAPTHNTPLLISEYGTNTTDEKLICLNQSTSDFEGDTVYNAYHWFKNGTSLTNLLLSFNTANSTNVKDYSSYNNNGTITGATWMSAGKIGGAYRFDGTDDYISIPDASSLDGDGTWTAMTIEFWLNPGKALQSTPTILEKRGGTGAQSYQIGFSSGTAGTLYCGYYVSGGYQQTSGTGCPVLQKGVWYHVVITYRNGTGIKIFVNGSLYASQPAATGTIKASNDVPVIIGKRIDNTRFFNGSLDEVKFYPFALTLQQINQNYNDSKNGYSNASRVVKEETSIGDVWRCDITPSDGKIDGLTKASNSLTIVPVYTLTITKSGSGSGAVEVTPSGPYFSGTVVTLWANASTGSTFTTWSGALSSTTTPEALTMDADKTVNAEFTSTSFLTINLSFDSGNIGSYTINGNSINFTFNTEHLINSGDYYTYWTNFKVQNTLNKNITFRITNANLVPLLTNTAHEVQIVYSYDGTNWSRFTNHTYTAGTYKFWKNFTANQVQIATFFPFSYSTMQEYLETVNASEWATKTELGLSAQNRNISLLTITNPGISNATKKVVYIIGRQHSAETTSSHMLKGMIDFLTSNNSDARRLRDSFIWYIVPMVNPDGVYLGYTRGTSLLRDPNDDWSNTNSVEINIVRTHLTNIKNTMGVDFFIDWHSHISDTSWYNYIYSPPGNTFYPILSQWTDFDTQTSPGVGSSSARGYATNLGIFTFTFEPTPHLSTWTLDSLHEQGVKTAFAIDEYFPLLVDPEFNASTSSEDLRANATTRDWFESRNNDPLLVGLDTNNIMGNLGKKAGFYTQDIQHYTYLSQEFRTRQTGRFTVSLDLLIDSISIYYDAVSKEAYNRTACLFIGSDDSDHTNGPCTTSNERFVFLTFFDNNPVENASDIVLKARESSGQPWNKTVQWTTVMANLSYDTWYRLTLDVDVANHSYDVYVNDVLVGEDISGYNNYVSNSISHITFYAGGTARGTFYVDNVFSPASERHSIKIAAQGNGSVSKTPGEATYRYGTGVQITATADIGWTFDHWAGDLSGNTNPKTIALTSDMNVTAVFTQNHYTLTTNTDGTGSITLTPPQSTFVYNESVMLQASGGSGWSFTHWTGNLTSHVNPVTLKITHDTSITAHFSNTALYTLTTNTVGSGYVENNPDRAVYEPSTIVTLTPIGNRGWSFNNWTGNVSGGHTHDNPLSITMDTNKILTASFNSSEPTILTEPVLNINSTSATLRGYLNDTGGENCSVWFEWDNSNVEECMGTIATGTVCKDGRSILQKNRHYYYDNVKPYFYQGTNYSFFGIGDYGSTGQCRMGQNEKGLAINNMDVSGTITHWKYQTDWSSGSQDHDSRFCLGNYSTVRDTAYYLAKHGYYYGNGSTNGQYLIISSEPGVGAIVAIDRVGHTNITWINNTYAGCANSWYCDGKWDTGDYNDRRAKIIMNDIVQNGTSSDGDHNLSWQDIAQRVAKDVSGREKGTGSYSYAGQIACGYSRSSVVSVAGNSSLNSSIHMSWVGIGQTTQVSIFLPLYAGNLHSISDIPLNFTTANGGKGIQPYADVKRNYARGNLADGNFYCSRVREILKYTSYNENLTFNAFDNLMDTIMYSADQQEARAQLDAFMETLLPKALHGYIANSTKSSSDTFKHYPQGVGYFSQAITGLKPGNTYYVKAWANNTGSDANGTIIRFMTRPEAPSNVQATHYGENQVNLSWTKGNGAFYTIIERNATGISSWARGEGIQIYNSTGNHCVDIGVQSTIQYYYKLWSYTTEKGLHQYSTNAATGYTGSNMPPIFTNINPNNGATGVLTNTSLLSVTIQDPEGNPISWTIQTSPNIGSNSGNGGNGSKTCSISGLTYGTTYTWFVNATDGTSSNNKIYTFTTKVGILVDPDFNANIHSADLRNNSVGQDWYESRAAYSGGNATLLTLDTNNIGGNMGKKAGLKSYGIASNAYLTQEFGAPQSSFFTVSFDINIDRIENSADFDRTGLVYIGDNSSTTNNCPTGTSNERFVHMTFYDPTPGDTGNDIEIRARTSSTQVTATTSLWTQVATGLNYDTWYNIKLIVFPSKGKYNVYVDGVLKGYQINKYSGYASSTVSFISFSADSDGRGDFYVDNVVSVPFVNNAPTITSELPVDSSSGVSISTSPLSVTIADSNSDLLNYTIQTSPNIGSSSGSGVTGGTKTCSISGLSYSTTYTWYVNVTDGINWTRKSYTFTTQTPLGNNPPAVSDPDPTNESSGVLITTSLLNVTIEDLEADPFNWTITTSPNVGSNSGTGASNGVKSCTLTGLTYDTTYTWYVKATDGNGWANQSFTFTTELAPVNDPPIISSPIPADGSTDISISTSLLSITIQDPEGNTIDWTIETSPNIGYNSGTGENGTQTCSISGLSNYTIYTWFVNATDGTSWMKETFTFTTKGLLADPGFDASVDDADLRANNTWQDWYESRNDNPLLLTLDTNNIGGNTGKKAAIKNFGFSKNVYLTQEFSSPQTGTFDVSFDIYIDKIEDNAYYDRTGHIYIGNNWNGGYPLDTARERYVLLAFYDSTPGDTGNDLQLRARTLSTTAQSWSNTSLWPTVASGLSYDTWYTIKVAVNYQAGTYNVTINGVTTTWSKMDIYNTATDPAISFMSFSADKDARGDFYVDNVHSPAIN